MTSDQSQTYKQTDEPDKEEDKDIDQDKLEYGVGDVPPKGITLFYVFQVTFGVVNGPIMCSYFLYEALCPQGNQILLAKMMSTSLVMVGITTFLQASIGIRLPIIQGSSILYVLPALGLASSGAWPCPDLGNSTVLAPNLTSRGEELWVPRMADISGGIALAGLVHACLGLFGIIGSVVKYLGPIPIGTMLVGIVIDIVFPAIKAASKCWIVSSFTASMGLIFALFMDKIQVPIPSYNKTRGLHIGSRHPLFKLYSVAMAMLCGWMLCIILTEVGYYTDNQSDPGYAARYDSKSQNIHQTKWIYIPYPGQFGWPSFSTSVFISMLAATAGSIADSIGDYGICARLCKVKPPPRHAVNRGILIEGIGTIISGVLGSAHATTTYTGTMGLIVVTRMGSRRVYQLSGIFLLILGIFGKIGGVFSTIPSATIGGASMLFLGMLTSIAVTTLTSCNMNLSRNRMVFGGSIGPALVVSNYLRLHPEVIDTGSSGFDDILRLVLGTCMIISGILAIILDNITPGSLEDRGIESLDEMCEESQNEVMSLYDTPYGMKFMKKHSIFSYIPFLPVYKSRSFTSIWKRRKSIPTDNNCDKSVNISDVDIKTGRESVL